MPRILRAADRPEDAPRTIKFEGGANGPALSFFAVVMAPEKHVALHVHPYTETWFIQEGEVRFTAGNEIIAAGPGDIMVVEPETPHGFRNVGNGDLKMMCMHDSPEIIQTFLEIDDS